MLANEEHLRACGIPKHKWDYCAHLIVKLEGCRADHYPLVYKCKKESHDLSMCYLDE